MGSAFQRVLVLVFSCEDWLRYSRKRALESRKLTDFRSNLPIRDRASCTSCTFLAFSQPPRTNSSGGLLSPGRMTHAADLPASSGRVVLLTFHVFASTSFSAQLLLFCRNP